jgi:integrase
MAGKGRIFKRGSRWWIAFSHRGEFRQSAGTREEARTLLRARLAEITSDRFKPEDTRLAVKTLLDSYVKSLRMREAKSLISLLSHLKPIEKAFGNLRVAELSIRRFEAYQEARLSEVGKATVDREMEILRAALRLAHRQERISRVPYIPMFHVDNRRRGFFDPNDADNVLRNLPDELADFSLYAYLSGWRVSEIRSLRFDMVDFAARELRIPDSKNGDGRTLTLEGELMDLIEKRMRLRSYETPEGPADSPWIFHRKGKPVGDFRKAWKRACEAAGVPGKLFHDFRRTHTKNMNDAGVHDTVGMMVTGHKTRATYDRYNIKDLRNMRAALRDTQAYVASVRKGEAGGVALGEAAAQKAGSPGEISDKSRTIKEKGVSPVELTPLDSWLRGQDLNLRPLGYEPNELPGCSTPRQGGGP